MTEPMPIDDASSAFYDGIDPANPTEEEDDQGLLHMDPRVLWGLMLVSIAVCTPIVFYYAPDDWGVVRTLVASVITGVLSHYCLFINRILVAKW